MNVRSGVLASCLSVALLGLAGCDNTHLIDSWTARNADSARLTKIVTIAVTRNYVTRHLAEADMAQQLIKRGIKATPAYAVLNDGDLRNVFNAKKKLAKAGFDGAVIVRPLGTEREINYAGGEFPPYYGTFWGYYDWAWPYVYEPGYTYTTTVLNMETLVYSVDQDRLLWAGMMQNNATTKFTKAVNGVAKDVAETLRDKGITPVQSS